MAVQLIVRIAPWAPSRVRRARRLHRLWLTLGALAALLLLLIGFGCTSGGGPPAGANTLNGPPANGTTLNSLVEASGGGQTSANGALGNQGILGQEVTLKASQSGDGTLQNQSGLYPPSSSQ